MIPGPDDIDLYLENSSGTIVAASTNGGTDELIELVLPADDTYTLVVHGWSVPTRTVRLCGRHVVGAVDAGRRVAQHRQRAGLGHQRSGRHGHRQLDAVWRRETSYLGAVSHSGDAGLLGLTLVNVQS